MDVSIVVASIAGTVALPSARLATTQATKARKSGRTEQLEAKLDQLTADRHLLYLWNRQLVDHIYRGIGPPPPQPPPRLFTNDQKRTPPPNHHPPHHPHPTPPNAPPPPAADTSHHHHSPHNNHHHPKPGKHKPTPSFLRRLVCVLGLRHRAGVW